MIITTIIITTTTTIIITTTTTTTIIIIIITTITCRPDGGAVGVLPRRLPNVTSIIGMTNSNRLKIA